MKNTINTQELGFDTNLVFQISNSKAGFTRVIVIDTIEFNSKSKYIYIKANTYYYTVEGELIPELTHVTLNDGQQWIVENVRKIPVLTSSLNPITNPDYDKSQETTEDNYPYILGLQYDVYNSLLTNSSFPVSVASLLAKGIANDDAKESFNERKF